MSRAPWALILAAALTCTATAAAAGAQESRAPHTSPRTAWHTSWASPPHGLAPAPLRDQSVRMISRLSQGGDALRIRVQNTFGTSPLTLDAATVAPSSGRDAALAGDPRTVTFDGRRKVTVPAGGEVWSDTVAMTTRAQGDVAVSLAVSGEAGAGRHEAAFRTNYLSAPGSGDRTADESGAAYTEKVESTYLVSAVDVRNKKLAGTLVAYGSSVVDGTGSTNCGPGCTELGNNRRWTDDLARRADRELPGDRRFAVANSRRHRHHQLRGLPRHPRAVPRPGLAGPPRTGRAVPARGAWRALLLRDQRPRRGMRRRADHRQLPRDVRTSARGRDQGVRHSDNPAPRLQRHREPGTAHGGPAS